MYSNLTNDTLKTKAGLIKTPNFANNSLRHMKGSAHVTLNLHIVMIQVYLHLQRKLFLFGNMQVVIYIYALLIIGQ